MKPRDPEKETSLLDAALSVAHREGLGALTVASVAREAGLSVGTVYVYFDGKEDLLGRLYQRSKALASQELLAAVDWDDSFRACFRRIAANYFDFLLRYPEQARFQEAYLAAGIAAADTLAISQASFAPVLTLLDRGQREEQVKPWNPAMVLRLVMAVLKDAAVQARDAPEEERAARRDQAVAFCLDAVSL